MTKLLLLSVFSMTKQKKRNKKHCQVKRVTSMATLGTKDMLLVFCGGKKETQAFDKKTLRPVNVGPTIAESIAKLPFKWSVYIAVWCRRQDGQDYIQSEQYNFDVPYHRANIENLLNERHDELIRSCNQLHIVNIGWIGSTVNYDINDKLATELFTKQSAWEHLAEWEIEK